VPQARPVLLQTREGLRDEVIVALADVDAAEHEPYGSQARDWSATCEPEGQPLARRSQLKVVDWCQNEVVGTPSTLHLYCIWTGMSRSGSDGRLDAGQLSVQTMVWAAFALVTPSTGAGGTDGGLLASHAPPLHTSPWLQSEVFLHVLAPSGSRFTHLLNAVVPGIRLQCPGEAELLPQHWSLEEQ